MSHNIDPSSFDPFNQNFTLYGMDGQPFETNMAEIDYLRQYGIRIAINWATQIGASLILLLVLLLLTKREKRKSSIFVMNSLCLVLNTVRSTLQCIWLTTEWYNPYALIAFDYSRITAANRANSIATNTVLLLLVICIMISLSLQVWVVCITTSKLQRTFIMSATTLVALVAIGYRFAVTIISNKQTMKGLGMDAFDRLVTDMHITQAVSVWFYCCVFTFKLGHALIQRKRLRMNQFGPMQVIFIMGCQTMIIPAIFTSLQFYDSVPELASQSTTVICIFLPLSAIWAGLVSSDAHIGGSGPDGHQRLLKDQFYRSSSTTTNASRAGEKSSILAASTYIGSGKDPESPIFLGGPHRSSNMQDRSAIYVGRDWNVETGEASNKV